MRNNFIPAGGTAKTGTSCSELLTWRKGSRFKKKISKKRINEFLVDLFKFTYQHHLDQNLIIEQKKGRKLNKIIFK